MNEETKNRIAAINSSIIPEGYKKTKVGIVPVEWDRYKLSDISDELTEKAGNNPYETLSISAGIGFVNQANKFGKELSGKQYEKYIVLHKGDFSYNKGNSKKYPQGCIYQLKDRDEAAVPNVFESFRLNKGINDYYEQLFVSGFLNRQLFAKINHGVRDDGLLNLKGEDFYSCYVPSPPLPEQQKIAEILSTQDKLIELQEKKIEQLKELKKAYLQKMFPKKGSKYPELRFKGFTDPWEQRKLGDISDVTKLAGFEFTEHIVYSDKGSIIALRGLNVKNGQLVLDDVKYIDGSNFSKLSRSKLYVNDVLFTYVGTVGELAIIPENERFYLAPNVSRIRFISDYDAQFMIQEMGSKSFYDNMIFSLIATSSQPALSMENIRKFVITVPKNNIEQHKIGTFFSRLDTLIALHQRKSEQEKQKKKALMQLLLTGKMRCK